MHTPNPELSPWVQISRSLQELGNDTGQRVTETRRADHQWAEDSEIDSNIPSGWLVEAVSAVLQVK
jgi:hypothetical protein